MDEDPRKRRGTRDEAWITKCKQSVKSADILRISASGLLNQSPDDLIHSARDDIVFRCAGGVL